MSDNFAIAPLNSQLVSFERSELRREFGLKQLPFYGLDCWNAYELAWLNLQGKPRVAMATMNVPADSPRIFESKSLKIYLNGLHATRFSSEEELVEFISRDLSLAAGARVEVGLEDLDSSSFLTRLSHPEGLCLDYYDLTTDCYSYKPSFLVSSQGFKHERLYSNLLRTNCPITNQPDWASLLIEYEGRQINHLGLLKYIISLANQNEFHEHCVERIFLDLWGHCQPERLVVTARYTRRGGIDINPQRASLGFELRGSLRLVRQ